MKDIKYRDATFNDLPTIVEIYNSTIPLKMVTADTEPVTVESRITWLNEHTPDKRPLWIIENKNEIIGWEIIECCISVFNILHEIFYKLKLVI